MKSDSHPLVSIVIPCYNHENFVQECIQSVIDQTYQNIELIIIDDGSKDNSVTKIQELVPQCRARFVRFEFRHRSNIGLSATLNEGLQWCQGQFFCAIASDDIVLPKKTSTQVDFLKYHETCVGVFGGITFIFDGAVQKSRVLPYKIYNFNDILMHNHELPATTAMLRLQEVKRANGYPVHLVIEDWYMWLKLTEKGKSLAYLNDNLAFYRRHDKNVSNDIEKMILARIKVLNEFKSLSSIQYNNALAHCYLVAANDYISMDKNHSFTYFCKYLKLQKFTFKDSLFSKKILSYLFKFLVR